MQSDKTRPSAPLKKREKAVVRAAMRWAREVTYYTAPMPAEQALLRACARLARKPK